MGVIDRLTPEQQHEVVKRVIKRTLKPGNIFGEGAARMFEYAMQTGVSLNSTGPLITEVLLQSTGVHSKNDLNMTCSRERSSF